MSGPLSEEQHQKRQTIIRDFLAEHPTVSQMHAAKQLAPLVGLTPEGFYAYAQRYSPEWKEHFGESKTSSSVSEIDRRSSLPSTRPRDPNTVSAEVAFAIASDTHVSNRGTHTIRSPLATQRPPSGQRILSPEEVIKRLMADREGMPKPLKF